jgi:DNA-binding transcriptional LysR family regulator
MLDVVFTRPPFDDSVVDAVPIFHERIQAVVADDSPLASREELRIRDLADVTLLLWDRKMGPALYDRVLELYARNGVTPSMVATPGAGPYNHAGLMMVASGKGVYLCLGVPLTSPQPASGVAVLPVGDPGATIEVCVATRKRETSHLVSRFLDCVWDAYPQPRRVATA